MRTDCLRLYLIFATLLAGAEGGGNATASLVRNGSFETPELPGDAGNMTVQTPGWATSTGQGLNLQRNLPGLPAFDGRQWLKLDRAESRTVFQDLVTTPGQRYRISYVLSNSPTSQVSAVTVFWGGVTLATTTTTRTVFERFTHTGVATSPVTRLTFQSAGPADGDGDLIDDVAVVPEYGMVVAQFADGQFPNGDWKTSLLVSNPHDREVRLEMVVNSQEGVELDPALRVARTLRPRETWVYESPAAVVGVRQGWASITASADISLMPVFRQRVSGRPDFEAAVPPRAPTSRVVAPFDNQGGLVTSLAIVNPRDTRLNVDFTFHNSEGVPFLTRRLTLDPRRQTTFALPEQFPFTANIRGSVEMVGRTDAGALAEFSALGFRFNPTGPFTTLPF